MVLVFHVPPVKKLCLELEAAPESQMAAADDAHAPCLRCNARMYAKYRTGVPTITEIDALRGQWYENWKRFRM